MKALAQGQGDDVMLVRSKFASFNGMTSRQMFGLLDVRNKAIGGFHRSVKQSEHSTPRRAGWIQPRWLHYNLQYEAGLICVRFDNDDVM
jgi:hypothetical protein